MPLHVYENSTQSVDPGKSPKSMLNMLDVELSVSGLPARKTHDYGGLAKQLMTKAESGLPEQEADLYRKLSELAAKPVDGLAPSSISYQAPAAGFPVSAVASASEYLPEGSVLTAAVGKHGAETLEVHDAAEPGFYNHIELESAGGVFTRQSMGHYGFESDSKTPVVSGLRDLAPGDYGLDLADFKAMASELAQQARAVEMEREAVRAREHDGYETSGQPSHDGLSL